MAKQTMAPACAADNVSSRCLSAQWEAAFQLTVVPQFFVVVQNLEIIEK